MLIFTEFFPVLFKMDFEDDIRGGLVTAQTLISVGTKNTDKKVSLLKKNKGLKRTNG